MKSIHILLVEDNEGDILLTIEALADSKITNRVSVIRDGKEAIDFFESTTNKADIPDPEKVLLDINLPKKSGHEVLQYMKKSVRHSHIPIIMLTTSSSEKDILSAYKHYANCYITKPIDVSEFIDAESQKLKIFGLISFLYR